MDKNTEMIINKLPEDIQTSFKELPDQVMDSLEEIRLKTGYDTILISNKKETIVNNAKLITPRTLEEILNRLLDYSYYAHEDDLCNGYITLEGGHRVGICGKVTLRDSRVHLIKEISSLNIRKSREIIGAADRIMKDILDKDTGVLANTLIISPPKCGKTTLIRDISRTLSLTGYRVGICDERSEIAGCYDGKPGYDLGPRTDILDSCPKAQGIKMLIRSMSPDVIVTDEIGKTEDVAAVKEALSAGVKIITTIHGSSYEEVENSIVGELIKAHVFDALVFLSSKPTTGTIRRILKSSNTMKGMSNDQID